MTTMLSAHFSLEEMIRSDTAARLALANYPDAPTIAKLKNVCINILEPVRAHYGRPVQINSGYRAPAVNAAVGSKPTSQHARGEAVDFEVPGISNAEVAVWVRDNLRFDQLILENHRAGIPSSGWVHCSWKSGQLRRSILTMTLGSHGAVYSEGLAR